MTLAALLTSMLSAVAGLGGGVLLMLLMPGLVPVAAVIPLHAVVQSVSNAARVAFALPSVAIGLVPPLLLGSLAGALVGSLSVGMVSLEWLPAVAGAVILIITWLPVAAIIPRGRVAFYVLGFYQTGLGMLAGATGAGVMMALFMANAGGAWDNAKKYIESGALGGKGSEAHKAAVQGDTVGDPFKDTAGPSINILMKLMTIAALVALPLFR